MEKEFNKSAFMSYMEDTFSGMENSMFRNMIENVIDYGLENNGTFSAFCEWVSRMIPEVTFQEVARFMIPATPDSGKIPNITRETIKQGIEKGVVKFIIDPNMGSGTVCKIGEGWFYFGGMTAEKEDPDEFLANSNQEEVVTGIYETLMDFNRMAECQTEYAYYAYFLQECGC